jgi:hypothetical protein
VLPAPKPVIKLKACHSEQSNVNRQDLSLSQPKSKLTTVAIILEFLLRVDNKPKPILQRMNPPMMLRRYFPVLLIMIPDERDDAT